MSGQKNPAILRFDGVSFWYGDEEHKKMILNDASFVIRENTKITIMGQNGAGKSTLFKLILGELQAKEGKINLNEGKKIAIARQIIPHDQKDLSVRERFESAFDEQDYQLDKKIASILQEVNLVVTDYDKKLYDFSGGQQARLLLAHALIQEPDILLLDEPTNNLDDAGIGELITFLMMYEHTVIVISHDADFLNIFTEGVLYLNVMKQQVEQYRGNYDDVQEQIQAQVEKEIHLNAREEKRIKDAKEKINYFANKGGKMRKVANKMRDEVAEAEENKVEVRRDDKTIRDFEIPFNNYVGDIVVVKDVELMDTSDMTKKTYPLQFPIEARKGDRYILKGPNGIGKSTLLKRMLAGDDSAYIGEEVKIGYYSQDFAALDMQQTARDSLAQVSNEITDEQLYKVAAGFLITGKLLQSPVFTLSEGQKALLTYARFVIQEPDLLILDEPSNHINFRHLPIITQAINDYKGAIIMVSHDEEFVKQIDHLQEVDLGRIMGS